MQKKKEDRESGFEALLRPVRDVIAKDWEVRLTKYLDDYINHIHSPGDGVNFSEAALVLQNSSTYYSRRVDIMYTWVRKFATSLLSSVEEPEEHSSGPRKTKKRVLQTENLQCLPYSHPDSKINMKFEKLGERKIEEVVLNKSLKAPCKPNTSCAVLQLNKEEMGYKEEFRLHWKTSNDGPLHEDFLSPSSHCLISAGVDNNEDSSDVDMDANDDVRDHSPDRSRSMILDEVAPPVDITEFNENRYSANLEHIDVSKEIPDNEVIDVHHKEPDDPFNIVIPHAALITHKKFKKGTPWKISKKVAEKQKNVEREEILSYHFSFYELLGGKKEDMPTYKLRLRKEERLKLIRKERREAAQKNIELDPAVVHDDIHDNTEDDHVEFEEHMAAMEATFNESINPPEAQHLKEIDANNFNEIYAQSVRSMLEYYKRTGDALQTAKAVAQWHSSIKDVISSAENISKFDVHSYGTQIINMFDSVGATKPFADIVTGQPQTEICRYLLSSLMLANTYNVVLSKSDPSELSRDCLRIKLISTVRHHEELDANMGAATAGTSQ